MVPLLELKNITKTFSHPSGDVKVLVGINLQLHEGELVSIIGPSGCGKTTLLECIAGFITMDQGSIVYEGKNQEKTKSLAGYMSQNDSLLPWRNLEQNIAIPLELAGISKKERVKKVATLIELCGLTGFEKHLPASLSGGMRQRAALARTYLTQKNILLFDEPFGKLDALTRLQMQEWFLSVWERERKTILMVTHDIDEAILLSDRIYILTERPASVLAEIQISLQRPRHLTASTSEEFTSIKKKIFATLHLLQS